MCRVDFKFSFFLALASHTEAKRFLKTTLEKTRSNDIRHIKRTFILEGLSTDPDLAMFFMHRYSTEV